MRVLLVDDEVEFVSTLAERLAIRGIHVEWATTGSDALKRVESESFDLAILDMKLPRIGGLELKEKLHAICPAMKFMFLTGYGSEKDFQAVSAQFGKDYYLVKPVDIEVLIEKMNAIVGP